MNHISPSEALRKTIVEAITKASPTQILQLGVQFPGRSIQSPRHLSGQLPLPRKSSPRQCADVLQFRGPKT
jgi:hypothetical protein